jgi:hypothetical protein
MLEKVFLTSLVMPSVLTGLGFLGEKRGPPPDVGSAGSLAIPLKYITTGRMLEIAQ